MRNVQYSPTLQTVAAAPAAVAAAAASWLAGAEQQQLPWQLLGLGDLPCPGSLPFPLCLASAILESAGEPSAALDCLSQLTDAAG